MSLHSRRGLTAKLSSKKYRDAFIASRISQTLAIQTRVLRQRAGLSQPELAKELGTSQNAVSRLESPKYGKQSISTLRKIAAYFDVGLMIRFAPFSEIMDWTLGMTEKSVLVPDFAHDSFGWGENNEPDGFGGQGAADSRFAGAPRLSAGVIDQTYAWADQSVASNQGLYPRQ